MSPLVLQPHTKNVPNSTQKIGTRAQSRSVISGDNKSEARPAPLTGAGVCCALHGAAARLRQNWRKLVAESGGDGFATLLTRYLSPRHRDAKPSELMEMRIGPGLR